MWPGHWHRLEVDGLLWPEVARPLVQIKSGRVEVGRALITIKSGRAERGRVEVVRPLITITSVRDEVARALMWPGPHHPVHC